MGTSAQPAHSSNASHRIACVFIPDRVGFSIANRQVCKPKTAPLLPRAAHCKIRCMAAFSPPQRVVVTGVGAVTPLGQDLPTTWRRLIAGEDGAGTVSLFDVSGCRCKIGGMATLPALPHVSAKKLKRLSRSS